jgi:virulence-associated protein VagC
MALLQHKDATSPGSWDEFFDGPGVSDDFMRDRDQPPPQEREFFD